MEREAERCTVDFSFVHQHGNDVTELISTLVEPGKTLVDLGCGNDALTTRL